MTQILGPVAAWYLAATVLGWLAFPAAYRVFRGLPDRGVAFIRPLALLVLGYAYWLGGLSTALPNNTGGALFLALAWGVAGAFLWRRQGPELLAFLRERKRLITAYEAIFLLAFVLWAVYRAAVPNIETAGGEKYMEMAFIDAILESPAFPPNDPWMSGEVISYYYFGYLQSAFLTHLTGLLPFIAFNLIVPMAFGMTLAAGASVGYNLAALADAARGVRAAAGAVGGWLVAGSGNFEGALEVAWLQGFGSPEFWNWLNIKNLTLRGLAADPTGICEAGANFGAGGVVPERFIWWWRASRVIHDGCNTEIIHEFPFFSFLLGDAHPHVMGLPFLIMIVALALALWTRGPNPAEATDPPAEITDDPPAEATDPPEDETDTPAAAMDLSAEATARRAEATDTPADETDTPAAATAGSTGSAAPAVPVDAEGQRLWRPAWLAVPLIVGAIGFLNAWDLPLALTLVWLAHMGATWHSDVRPVSVSTADAVLGGLAVGGAGLLGWRLAPALAQIVSDQAAAPTVMRVGVAVSTALLAVAFLELIRAGAEAGRPVWVRLYRGVRFGVWLSILALAFYAPFYVALESQVEGLGLVPGRTRLALWLVHMGPVAFFGATTALTGAVVLWRRRPLTLLSQVVIAACGLAAILGQLERTEGALAFAPAATPLLLALLVAASAGGAIAIWSGGQREANAGGGVPAGALNPKERAHAFALVCVALGFLLPLGVEFVFVRDLFGNRMNSVFKFYYQAWMLLALGGSYAIVAVTGWARRRAGRELIASVWSAAAVLVLVAAAAYPVLATMTRTEGVCMPWQMEGEAPGPGCQRALTLDGLGWWKGNHPDDLAAVHWLRELPGTPHILEATQRGNDGGSYSHTGRISMATGYPTVLGWPFHETQWGRSWEEIEPRRADVERIYTAPDPTSVLDVLRDYGVQYIVVGPMERSRYDIGSGQIERWKRVLNAVYEEGQVTIFELPGASGAPR